MVGEGVGGGRIAGRIGDGLGVSFFPGLVDSCLNSDSSDSCDGHSLRHGLMRRSSLRESGIPELNPYAGDA